MNDALFLGVLDAWNKTFVLLPSKYQINLVKDYELVICFFYIWFTNYYVVESRFWFVFCSFYLYDFQPESLLTTFGGYRIYTDGVAQTTHFIRLNVGVLRLQHIQLWQIKLIVIILMHPSNTGQLKTINYILRILVLFLSCLLNNVVLIIVFTLCYFF